MAPQLHRIDSPDVRASRVGGKRLQDKVSYSGAAYYEGALYGDGANPAAAADEGPPEGYNVAAGTRVKGVEGVGGVSGVRD